MERRAQEGGKRLLMHTQDPCERRCSVQLFGLHPFHAIRNVIMADKSCTGMCMYGLTWIMAMHELHRKCMPGEIARDQQKAKSSASGPSVPKQMGPPKKRSI